MLIQLYIIYQYWIVLQLNSEDIVLYRGETVINIIAGQILSVSLTLAPTQNGTGSIYLFVNWNSNASFIDYPQNPIILQQDYNNEYYGVRGPCVLETNGNYYMWYFTQSNHGKWYINLAISTNGLNWNYNSTNPIISPGEYGSWNDLRVGFPTVIYDDNEFKLYYTGFRGSVNY